MPDPTTPTHYVAAGFFYHAATASVLLHLRGPDAPTFPDLWSLFGGHSEPEDGGNPVATWVREVQEELGVALEPGRIRRIGEQGPDISHTLPRTVFWYPWPDLRDDFALTEGIALRWYPLVDALRIATLTPPALDALRRAQPLLRAVPDTTHVLYHVTTAAEWERCATLDDYEPEAFAQEHFIHTSEAHQVAGVLHRYYAGRTGLLILHIDPTKVDAPLKYEPATAGELFPHIRGRLNKDAVFEVERLG